MSVLPEIFAVYQAGEACWVVLSPESEPPVRVNRRGAAPRGSRAGGPRLAAMPLEKISGVISRVAGYFSDGFCLAKRASPLRFTPWRPAADCLAYAAQMPAITAFLVF